ncbi:MAG TPA: hypothetical protein VIJ46_01250, partial [Rhabdochlamydiaceae bacterium]
NNPQTQGISMAQFLRNVDAIPSGTLKIWEILKNVRDQAMYARVDPGSARKFLDLLDPELKKLDPLIASQSGKQNGIANA